MSLEKVISISGKPGLYKLVTQTRGGFVAESLIDKKRISVSVQNNVSVLSEIAIYTLTEEVPLAQVFENIKVKENGEKASVNPKDSKDKLEEYFFSILPEYDEDRVYASDIKKVIQWYNLLQEHKMLDNLVEAEAEATESSEEEA
ncbi:DUF5606 domain-containing protein [Pseudotamlana carrageenivorans]|uniref:Uncharacterized protein n=1 Tax=Pseudotamlana carrageenivorans TaxID=2069432 RepID=A0A2I7SDJ9_9FLAO|nr:DUF5606 domain-containing protein [Tamlana carrageenivorans]AUS03974.1 hypothetical protein C1A40_00065 [Tamlana carrageenivorans]